MAFSTEYTITAKDQFTSVANKIAASFDALNKRAALFTIEMGKINASMSHYKTHFTTVTTEIKQMSTAMREVNTQMGSFSKRKLGNQFGGGAGGGRNLYGGGLRGGARGAAFAGGMSMLSRQFMGGYVAYKATTEAFGSVFEMEQKMAEMSALTGKTGDELDRLKTAAYDMGIQFKMSSADAADGMIMIGNQKADLLDSTQAMEDYSIAVGKLYAAGKAGGMTYETAAKGMISLQNIFGMSNEDAIAKIPNMMAGASRAGGVEVGQITRAVLNVGGTAKQSGISPQDLLTMIELGGKTTIGKAGQEGTAFKSMLTRLPQQGYSFKKYGVAGVFKMIETKANSFGSEAKRLEYYKKVFGQYFIGLGETLASVHGDFEALKEKIGNGDALEMGTKNLDNTIDKWQGFKTALSKLSGAVINTSFIQTELDAATFDANDIADKIKNHKDSGVMSGYWNRLSESVTGMGWSSLNPFMTDRNYDGSLKSETSVQIGLTDEARQLLTTKVENNKAPVGKNLGDPDVPRLH